MIRLTETFLSYQRSMGFTEIRVDAVSTQSSCCRILVPKVSLGPPLDAAAYVVIRDQGLTFYISNQLSLEATLTFSCQTLLGRTHIDMHGFAIKRISGFSDEITPS